MTIIEAVFYSLVFWTLIYVFLKTKCFHKYKTIDSVPVVESKSSQIPIGECFYLRCEKCGRVSKKIL
jgi:hypothetical protein